MKFGGSSVASAERMWEVARIVCSFPELYPCIVLSAMGKVSLHYAIMRKPTGQITAQWILLSSLPVNFLWECSSDVVNIRVFSTCVAKYHEDHTA